MDSLGTAMARLETGDLSIEDPELTSSFLFPHAVGFPGHLHMIFGALRNACRRMEDWPTFEKQLRALARFLSSGLRGRFIKSASMATATWNRSSAISRGAYSLGGGRS